MARRVSRSILAAAAGVAALVWAALAWRDASRALESGREAVASAGRFAFERRAWEADPGPFEIVPAAADFVDAARFGGSVWLAGRGGLYRYSAEGALVRAWLVGADLPPAPLAALAVGLDPRAGAPALFAATDGEGLLIVSEDGRVERLRAAEPGHRGLTALLPLADGRVLLGTKQAGVLVYDATGLTALSPELDGAHIVALAGEPGDVWAATLGRGLVHLQGGRARRFAEADGLPDRRLLSLAAADGAVYAGAAVGVAEFRDGAFVRPLADGFFAFALLTFEGELLVGGLEEGVAAIPLGASRPRAGPAVAGPSPVRRLLSLDGEIYALTPSALWRREPDGAWTEALAAPPAPLTDRNLSALHVDSEGRLWAGFFDRGLDLVRGAERLVHLEDETLYCVNRIVPAPQDGLVAVAAANGLVFVDGAGRPRQTLRRADGLLADHVADVVFRPGGWVAATPAGLSFFDAGGFRGLYVLHGLASNHVYALGARGDTLLAGTLGGLTRLEGGAVRESYTTANSPLGHNWISAIAEFRGDWYIGTYGAGVARLGADGRWTAFPDMRGVEINPNSMAATESRVYAGTLDGGVLVYEPEADRWAPLVRGLPSANVTALAASGGAVYFGTENGLARAAEEAVSWR